MNSNKSPTATDGLVSPNDSETNKKNKKKENSTSKVDHLISKAQFILIFGDQTYQQYGLCLRIPVKHYDYSLHVVVNTSYVICLMTKMPFFNYIFDILADFDSTFHGLKFNELLEVQDSLLPLQSELKLMNELALKLKKVSIPLYPFLLNKNKSAQSSDTSLDLFSQLFETVSILPDINFQFSGKHKKVIELQFKRTFKQCFYSEYKSAYNIQNDLEVSNILNNMQIKNIDFIPDFLCKSEREKEDAFMVLVWALPVLLKHLPLDQIILALGCAVTEMKIVVKHTDVNVISSVVFALIHLLRPLRWKWSLPVIVLLPDNLSDILGIICIIFLNYKLFLLIIIIDSPFPIIVGLQKLPESFLLQERVVVIDPLERIVHLNPIDVVLSHTILLPHASKLVHALKSPTEVILKLSKKRKFYKNDKPNTTTNDNQTSDTAAKVSNINIAVDEHVVVSPVTNDFEVSPISLNQFSSSDSPTKKFRKVPSTIAYSSIKSEAGSIVEYNAFLTAIKSFTSIVYNHIQAIVNTAILLKLEERQTNRLNRRVLLNPNNIPRPKKENNIELERSDSNIKLNKKTSTNQLTPPKRILNDKRKFPPDLALPKINGFPKDWLIAHKANSPNEDDNYSEITFTDSMAGKTETNDVENDFKEIVVDKSNSSICSDSSSLPTLQKVPHI